MEQDLFAEVDKNIQSDFYKEMLAKRTRPDIHGEQEAGADRETGTGPLTQEREVQSYPYERVLEESTRYFRGDTLAANVWINKYALKDSNGKLYELTPDDMHWRLARRLPGLSRSIRIRCPWKRSIIYSKTSGTSSRRVVRWREWAIISRYRRFRIAL